MFHERSSVVDVLAKTRAGVVVTFREGDAADLIAGRIEERWFAPPALPAPETDWAAFEPYTAREIARKQCEVFDACRAPHRTLDLT